MSDTMNQASDVGPASNHAKRRSFRFRGTYALALWAPGLYLLMWASFAAAWVSLGRRPYPSRDDPKWIEGFWMWVYDLSGIWVTLGLPLAMLLALVSLFMTRRAEGWIGRLRLPEGGLALSVVFWVGWYIAEPQDNPSLIEDVELAGWYTGLFLRSLFVAIAISLLYLFYGFYRHLARRGGEAVSERTRRLREIAWGYVVVMAGWTLIGLDVAFNPLGVVEWWFD